jgi:Protein of unknown function (DUF2949)
VLSPIDRPSCSHPSFIPASPPEGLSTEPDKTDQLRQNRAELGGDLSVAPATYSRFIQFLTDEMAVSNSSIDFALRHRENACDPLPMILWQYGLISLEQLDRIFAWLETA